MAYIVKRWIGARATGRATLARHDPWAPFGRGTTQCVPTRVSAAAMDIGTASIMKLISIVLVR
jgi:hypothetical protein